MARDDLRGVLERTQVDTEEEARSLEKFKETKMGQVFITNMAMVLRFKSNIGHVINFS